MLIISNSKHGNGIRSDSIHAKIFTLPIQFYSLFCSFIVLFPCKYFIVFGQYLMTIISLYKHVLNFFYLSVDQNFSPFVRIELLVLENRGVDLYLSECSI